MQCPHCQAELPTPVRRCPQCGKAVPRAVSGSQRQTAALTGARQESERHFRRTSRWLTAAWSLLAAVLLAAGLAYTWRHLRHRVTAAPDPGVQIEDALTEAGYDARLAKARIGFVAGLHSADGPVAVRLAGVIPDDPPRLELEVRAAPLPAIAIPGAAWHYTPARLDVRAVQAASGEALGAGILKDVDEIGTDFRFQPADEADEPAVQFAGSLALNDGAAIADFAHLDARLHLRLPLQTRRHTLQVRHLPKTVAIGDSVLDLEQNGPSAILIRYRAIPPGLVAIVARDARENPLEARVQLAATAMEVRLPRPAKTLEVYFTDRFLERTFDLSLDGRLRPETIDGIRAGREAVLGGVTLRVEAASAPGERDEPGASDQAQWTLALHGEHQQVLWLGPVSPTGERRSVIELTTDATATVRRFTIGFLDGEGGSHLGMILAQPAP